MTQAVPASKDLAAKDNPHSIPVKAAGKVRLPSFLQMCKLKGGDLVKVMPLCSVTDLGPTPQSSDSRSSTFSEITKCLLFFRKLMLNVRNIN